METALVTRSALGAEDGSKLLSEDQNHLFFCSARLFTMLWRKETTVEAVVKAQRLIRRFAEEQLPKRIALLTIIESGAFLPGAGTREELAQLMRVNSDYLVRSAVAQEGTGFKASAFRSVATGIALLSHHSFPHRVFASVEMATQWLVKGLSDELRSPVSGHVVASSVRSARRR